MSNSRNSEKLSNLVRLTNLHLHELPAHSDLPQSEVSKQRPDLPAFIRAVLDEGAAFLHPSAIKAHFQASGTKSASPSTASVQVLKRSITAATLTSIPWSNSPIPRQPPPSSAIEPEYWFMRRSLHANISSKETKGSASWPEFVYGLRDEHSHHEMDFTPTLYDAHHILDWNSEIQQLESTGHFSSPSDTTTITNSSTPQHSYTSITMSIYEMCHAIPPPLAPRCFPVLVLTASTSPTSFIAVTIPLDLSLLKSSFYTSGRNTSEGIDAQHSKSVILGAYTAVETVRILDDSTSGDDGSGGNPGEIEWTMATASDAKGNLPMWVQKMSMPGAVPKDVSYFMDWIPSVSVEEIENQKVGTH